MFAWGLQRRVGGLLPGRVLGSCIARAPGQCVAHMLARAAAAQETAADAGTGAGGGDPGDLLTGRKGREVAVRVLGQVSTPEARSLISARLSVEREAHVRATAESVLGRSR